MRAKKRELDGYMNKNNQQNLNIHYSVIFSLLFVRPIDSYHTLLTAIREVVVTRADVVVGALLEAQHRTLERCRGIVQQLVHWCLSFH